MTKNTGKFKDASITYTSAKQINIDDLVRWLENEEKMHFRTPAPRLASISAVASPIPLLAPVMTTTFPAIAFSMLYDLMKQISRMRIIWM